MRKTLLIASVSAALAAGIAYAGSGLGTATASARFAAGTLNLRGTLSLISDGVECPPAVPPDATECRARTGKGLLQGLGTAAETYSWSFRMGAPTCPANLGKPLATTGRLVVEGKGEIQFALANGARCIAQEPIRNEPQSFTITGGTGTYEGASGSGTVERNVNGGRGTETWTGALVVPRFEFDATPPTLSGARSKIVRAPKRANGIRVTYTVTATDAVDREVAVTCLPRSGTRFLIGPTVVACEASDSSGNTGRARFVVTVKSTR